MIRPFLILAPAFLTLSTFGAWADARMSVLVDVLQLQEAAEILADEGMTQAQTLNEDMLAGQGGPAWAVQVEQIYAPARMVERVRGALEDELAGDALESVIEFYASPLGSEIIELENAARRAIQDPDVEEAARARYQDLKAQEDLRLGLVTALIDGGDMIDLNVTSAMNSSFQFFRGLVDGKALDMTEQEMLNDVSKDIDASTQDTTEWLSGYMLLAYHPLTDEELMKYVAFSETEAGEALNRALFAGFGKAYEDISYSLGRAVALNMQAQEL